MISAYCSGVRAISSFLLRCRFWLPLRLCCFSGAGVAGSAPRAEAGDVWSCGGMDTPRRTKNNRLTIAGRRSGRRGNRHGVRMPQSGTGGCNGGPCPPCQVVNAGAALPSPVLPRYERGQLAACYTRPKHPASESTPASHRKGISIAPPDKSAHVTIEKGGMRQLSGFRC